MDRTYLNLEYNSKARWVSYWYQVFETLELSPSDVLLIGKGSGIVEHSIRQIGNGKTSIITLDISHALKPDIVGDVIELPIGNNKFDVAVCCQVLEHLPFDMFPAALSELHRVARNRVIISLPHKRKYLKISYHLPLLKDRTIILKHPFTKKHCSSKQHHWEITRGVSQHNVIQEINKFFDIEKNYLNEINCEHRFFILKRKK